MVTLTLKDKRSFFGEMAGEINPIPLQVLMKGRSDRMDRTFASGEKGDIYVAVLKAIASLMPRSSIKSQDIKKAVTELVVAEFLRTTKSHESLERMSEIAKEKSNGRPVIELDKEGEGTLNIIDPAFGFYLKWGNWHKAK